MDLTALLDELRSNILNDRSDRTGGGTSDYLWSDATLVRYINEACRRFARQGLVIRDKGTPEVTQINLQTGVSEYTLHEAVLAVMSARLAGDAGDLARTGHSALDSYQPPNIMFFDPTTLGALDNGKPIAFTTDEYLGTDENNSVSRIVYRVYPAPSSTYNNIKIDLRILRMPLEHLTMDNLDCFPEIPEMHHLEMLDWAAYLALRIVDVDAGDPDRAAEFRASFEEHVTRARRVAMRKMFTPLHWGFGRSGFSWEQGNA